MGLLSKAEASDVTRAMHAVWLRRAAYSGWPRAIEELADDYSWGREGLPKDREVAACLRGAQSGSGEVHRCRSIELKRGYIASEHDISVCGACGE